MFPKRKNSIRSESEQIKMAQADHREFGPLYASYFETIFRFIFKKLGGNEAVAGDLTQSTFLKAMANLNKYEDRGLPFGAWLYRIAQNEVNLFFRSQKNNYFVEVTDRQVHELLDAAGEENHTELDIAYLVQKINNLEESQQEIIELRFFQSMSFKEIAAIYGISEANAKMRVYRILEKLKQQWVKQS